MPQAPSGPYPAGAVSVTRSERLFFWLNIGAGAVKGRAGEKNRAPRFFGDPLKRPATMIPMESRSEEPDVSRPKIPSKASRTKATSAPEVSLRHLRREVRTALELAVVALAPTELVERLAAAAGLLEALIELPADSPPALALVPSVVERTQASLDDWLRWRREKLEKKMPRS